MDAPAHRPAIRKRKYSRRGCQECKRRKIKCDEVHPACGNCVRVEIACVFPDPNSGNRPRQRRRPKSPRDDAGSHGMVQNAPFSSPPANNIDMLLFENVFDDANTLVHGLADFETHVAPAMGASSPSASERLGDLKPFHSQIILNESPKKKRVFRRK